MRRRGRWQSKIRQHLRERNFFKAFWGINEGQTNVPGPREILFYSIVSLKTTYNTRSKVGGREMMNEGLLVGG